MLGLLVLTRVSDDKRHELVQSLSSFYAEADCKPYRRFVLQDLNDESLLAWVGYWRAEEGLEAFLASPTFQAIKGAADTLGHLDDVQRLSFHSLLPERDSSSDTKLNDRRT